MILCGLWRSLCSPSGERGLSQKGPTTPFPEDEGGGPTGQPVFPSLLRVGNGTLGLPASRENKGCTGFLESTQAQRVAAPRGVKKNQQDWPSLRAGFKSVYDFSRVFEDFVYNNNSQLG